MSKFFFGILLSLFTLCCVSCNDDDNHAIELRDVESNSLTLIYPANYAHSIRITGGDGSFDAKCDNEQILVAKLTLDNEIDPKHHYLTLKPLSIGNTIVTISDQSKNVYRLNVAIKNLEHDFKIIKRDVLVIGSNLTIEEQEAIKESALASIPVEVDGLYKFVFKDTNQTRGDVYIYPTQIMATREQGTFVREIKEVNEVLMTYTITMPENKVYIFDVFPYLDRTKSTTIQEKLQFREDLTDKYKAEYPNVEAVYTMQVIEVKE